MDTFKHKSVKFIESDSFLIHRSMEDAVFLTIYRVSPNRLMWFCPPRIIVTAFTAPHTLPLPFSQPTSRYPLPNTPPPAARQARESSLLPAAPNIPPKGASSLRALGVIGKQIRFAAICTAERVRAMGRDPNTFYIHAGKINGERTASQGCVIMGKEERAAIRELQGAKIRVVR